MTGRVLHAARTISPVDHEAGMGVERVLGMGVDVLGEAEEAVIARGGDPLREPGLAGQHMRLHVEDDHQLGVRPRRRGEGRAPGQRRGRRAGAHVFDEQRHVDVEEVERAGDAGVGGGGEPVGLAGGIAPGAIDEFKQILLLAGRRRHRGAPSCGPNLDGL